MNFPDQDAFVLLSGQSGLVPVHRTIIADLDTPLTIYAKVSDARQHAFLFESMEGGEKWGRYSFIGLDPLLTFTSRGDKVTVSLPGTDAAPRELAGVNPLYELRSLLASFRPSNAPAFHRLQVWCSSVRMERLIG